MKTFYHLFLHLILLQKIIVGYICPEEPCTCEKRTSWTCNIKSEVEQINCEGITNSDNITMNLALSFPAENRNSLLMKNCRISTLLIRANHIPSNNMLKNLNTLSRLVVLYNKDQSSSHIEFRLLNLMEGLESLKDFFLHDFTLDIWRAESLEICYKLEEFMLGNMKLKIVEEDSFRNCKNLKNLRLKYNNISELLVNSFSGLTNLEMLYLSHNEIMYVKTGENNWWDLRSLAELDLSHNRLSELHPKMFIGLRNLKTLLLHNNKIKFIFSSAFEGLDNLVYLDLEGNKDLKFFDLFHIVAMRHSLNKTLVDKAFVQCISNKSNLKLFQRSVQDYLSNFPDCSSSIENKLDSDQKPVQKTTPKMVEEIVFKSTLSLIVTVAVLCTLLFVGIFISIFCFVTSRKKIRKYKSASDRLTNHSGLMSHNSCIDSNPLLLRNYPQTLNFPQNSYSNSSDRRVFSAPVLNI